jgi:hypothetical protein
VKIAISGQQLAKTEIQVKGIVVGVILNGALKR